MSRIKLRTLINLTEQAPQPPMEDPAGPAGSPAMPPQGMNAGGPDQETPEPAAAPDTSPEPEDPGEYDFTRDFRAFEDKKNKAESDAKKVLLEKMNKRLLGKTIVANASRGYGQPKTDYTIKSVKKISVEFWYKDYVVIASDENDKKYFLTPGINIKIESEGSEPAPGGEEQPPTVGQDGQEGPPGSTQPPAQDTGAQELPNAPQPTGGEPAPEPQGVQPDATAQPPAAPTVPNQEVPEKPSAPPQAKPNVAPEVDPKKKKKLPPVAEWIQEDLSKFLLEFMSDEVKNSRGNVNFVNYIQETSKMLAEGVDATKVKVKLLIPESHMVNVDNRDIKLAAINAMRQRTYSGQYSKGSIEVNKTGRYYLLEYVKEIGWNK